MILTVTTFVAAMTLLLATPAVATAPTRGLAPAHVGIPSSRAPTAATRYVDGILAMFPTAPARSVQSIRARQTTIEQNLLASESIHGVPMGIMLMVAWAETHVGGDINEGGNWGAPIDPQHRHTAGTPLHAARALRRSYEVCGSWYRAVARFRSGLCRPHNPTHQRYTRTVTYLARRLYLRVGDTIPPTLEEPHTASR